MGTNIRNNKRLASLAILVLSNCILGTFSQPAAVDKCELLLPDGENVLDTSKEHIVNVPINETHVQGKAPIAIVAPVEANKSVSIIGDQFSKLIRLSTSKPNEIQFFFQKDAVTEFLGKENDHFELLLNAECENSTTLKIGIIKFNLKYQKNLQFDKETELKFPSPILSGITLINGQVFIENKNLPVSKRSVTFSVDENLKDSFEITSLRYADDNSKFYFVLKTKTAIDLTQDLKLNITATDEYKQTASKELTLKVNNKASLPEFAQEIYKADLSKETDLKNKGAAVLFNPEITLSRGTTEGLKYNLTKLVVAESEKSNYTQYFDITPKNESSIVVKIKNFKDVELGSELLLILEAKAESGGATTLLYLTLPKINPSPVNNSTTTQTPPTEEGGMSGWWWVVIIIAIIAVIGGLYYLNKRYLKLF